jgi:uncharacterized protein
MDNPSMTAPPYPRRTAAWWAIAAVSWCVAALSSGLLLGQGTEPPALTQVVNDFAGVIDSSSAQAIDRISRTLQVATGDVVVVATVPTVAPYADIREYAVRMFENRGRGIGERGKDNGLLILLALKEREVFIEVGYGLEQWITDGFAGETSRDEMVPEFRDGNYGAGLLRGVTRIAGRIAQGRNVPLEGVPAPAPQPAETQLPLWLIVFMLLVFILMARAAARTRRGFRRWGGGGWSGWSSGVGPFGGGGGWGGGGGLGGGFGGFGGFGGGRSGGGGGGGRW